MRTRSRSLCCNSQIVRLLCKRHARLYPSARCLCAVFPSSTFTLPPLSSTSFCLLSLALTLMCVFPLCQNLPLHCFSRPIDSTMSDTLHRVFSAFGPIVEAAVIYDKHTKRSKGYGVHRFDLSACWCQCSSRRVSFVFCPAHLQLCL